MEGAVGFSALSKEAVNLHVREGDDGKLDDHNLMDAGHKLLDASVDIPGGFQRPGTTTTLAKAIMCVPVVQNDKCVGVIQLFNKTTNTESVYTLFSQEDVEDMSGVATCLAAQLQRDYA